MLHFMFFKGTEIVWGGGMEDLGKLIQENENPPFPMDTPVLVFQNDTAIRLTSLTNLLLAMIMTAVTMDTLN